MSEQFVKVNIIAISSDIHLIIILEPIVRQKRNFKHENCFLAICLEGLHLVVVLVVGILLELVLMLGLGLGFVCCYG